MADLAIPVALVDPVGIALTALPCSSSWWAAAPPRGAATLILPVMGGPHLARQDSGVAIDSGNGENLHHAHRFRTQNTIHGELRITVGNALATGRRQVRRLAEGGKHEAARPGERFANIISTGFDAARWRK